MGHATDNQSPRFSDLLVYQSGAVFSDLETKLISLLVEAAADIQKTKKT